MTLSWTANTVPTRAEVTLPSSEHTHAYTPEGTVSKPTFTGTQATITVSGTVSGATTSDVE